MFSFRLVSMRQFISQFVQNLCGLKSVYLDVAAVT